MSRGTNPRSPPPQPSGPPTGRPGPRAAVRVRGEEMAAIGPGLVVLLGVAPGDDEVVARGLAAKVANLRIFRDEEGLTNRSLLGVGGMALGVSQFTLFADTRKGRRPSFLGAAGPRGAGGGAPT